VNEPQPEKRPLFFWLMVVTVGLYLGVRLIEGVLCVTAWLGWGSCPWSG
jgi:hypothetical protein